MSKNNWQKVVAKTTYSQLCLWVDESENEVEEFRCMLLGMEEENQKKIDEYLKYDDYYKEKSKQENELGHTIERMQEELCVLSAELDHMEYELNDMCNELNAIGADYNSQYFAYQDKRSELRNLIALRDGMMNYVANKQRASR